jgi:hypothetical protein
LQGDYRQFAAMKNAFGRGHISFQEYFDRRKDAAFIAAGMAYGEALRAAGVFVGGAGLQSPQAATTVSVRDGKRHVHDGSNFFSSARIRRLMPPRARR